MEQKPGEGSEVTRVFSGTPLLSITPLGKLQTGSLGRVLLVVNRGGMNVFNKPPNTNQQAENSQGSISAACASWPGILEQCGSHTTVCSCGCYLLGAIKVPYMSHSHTFCSDPGGWVFLSLFNEMRNLGSKKKKKSIVSSHIISEQESCGSNPVSIFPGPVFFLSP